jgi:proteic killer suppression protein
MTLAGFNHKGLKLLYSGGNPRGVPPEMVDRLRKLLFAMETAAGLDDLKRFPGWRLHQLKGDLAGRWSLSVSGNWRLTFRYSGFENEATDIDLIDYH